jgi:lipopolysaccharide export system ATP-binding protein
MAIIKKFRIKSFKKIKPIIKLDKISLSYGKRKINRQVF